MVHKDNTDNYGLVRLRKDILNILFRIRNIIWFVLKCLFLLAQTELVWRSWVISRLQTQSVSCVSLAWFYRICLRATYGLQCSKVHLKHVMQRGSRTGLVQVLTHPALSWYWLDLNPSKSRFYLSLYTVWSWSRFGLCLGGLDCNTVCRLFLYITVSTTHHKCLNGFFK